MTQYQQLYSGLLLFIPPILLSIYKEWWLGIVAFIASFILSLILTFTISTKLNTNSLAVWAWLKPAMIALVILYSGFYLV